MPNEDARLDAHLWDRHLHNPVTRAQRSERMEILKDAIARGEGDRSRPRAADGTPYYAYGVVPFAAPYIIY